MVHQKCIKFFLIEAYKYLSDLSLAIMNTIFKLRQNIYNLRNFHAFESQNPRTKKLGLDSIAYRAGQLWKIVPEEIRNSALLLIFKESIKKSLWFYIRAIVVKLAYITWVIFSLFKFSWTYLSTSCLTDLRIYLALYLT